MSSIADRRMVAYRPDEAMLRRLEEEAARNHRAVANEVAARIEASFAPAPDLRTIIREEIRAALAERDEDAVVPAVARSGFIYRY